MELDDSKKTADAVNRLAILFGKCPKRNDGLDTCHAWKVAERNSETKGCRFCNAPWPYRR